MLRFAGAQVACCPGPVRADSFTAASCPKGRSLRLPGCTGRAQPCWSRRPGSQISSQGPVLTSVSLPTPTRFPAIRRPVGAE